MEWILDLAPVGGSWSPEELRERAVSGPEVIARAIAEIGAGATGWAVETSERVIERVRSQDDLDGPRVGATMRERRASEFALLTALITIRHHGTRAKGVLPVEEAERLGRLACHQGVPLQVLVDRSWRAHSVSKDELMTALAAIIPPPERTAQLKEASAAMFDFANAFVHTMIRAYEEEHRSQRSRLAAEKHRLLTAIGEEEAEPTARAEKVLGATFGGGHIVAVAWYEPTKHGPEEAEGATLEFAARAGERLGARHLVCVEHEGITRLWWSFPALPAEGAAVRLRDEPRCDWLNLAIGPSAAGLDGFREAYRGAHQAARVGRHAMQGRTWLYDDVAHLALMIADPGAVASFVKRELRGLLGPGERLADIRTTVKIYLDQAHSRVAVAEALHIASNTVAYRVGQAGELLGYPVTDRAQLILLALQLYENFPHWVTEPPPR